ncbi:MAG: PD40 domain-containing protein, partial [Fimbriimonadaceae bacterium]|nr:PD40 domain-containing protein [Chitinophagales bacterium]
LQQDSLVLLYLLKAIALQDDYDVGVYKKLAEAEQRLMLYEGAGEHIKIFLEHPKITGVTRRNAEQFLTSIEFAINAVNNPVEFNPVNLGKEVNSEYSEYFPSIAADNSLMVFTRKIPQEGEANFSIGETPLQEDFYLTTNNNDVWSVAQNVGKPVNTRLNEGAQNISADGRYLFYTLCQSPNGFGRCDLYYAIKFGDIWSYPENCGKNINGGDWESQPSISADGKYLYFCSTRPGGLGGHDIWYAEINENGTWNKALNAGAPINTPYDEQSPFMHPDGRTIYFSSNGHPNMGGSDLFYAKKGIDDKWQQPVNLGYPINTSTNEITLTVSTDGTTAYYASDREEGFGGLDIYKFDLPEKLRPEPVTYVKATVRDERTKAYLKSNIQLIDLETGNILLTATSDSKSGEFLVVLPVGKKYALYVNKEGYLFHSENFSLENVIPDKPYLIDIYLQPVEVGEIITLRNIFFETASAALLPESKTELLKVNELLTKNPEIKIKLNGHTDNVGSDNDNLQLSIDRALSVKTFLIEQGIDATRIVHAGYGETKPLTTNDTEEGRAQNRRTEMEIVSR